MMNEMQRGILALMKSAATGEKLALPEDFSLEDAYPLISKHNLIPLAYEGAVNCGISLQDPVMNRMFRGYCRHMQVSERQMKAVGQVCDAFDANGIDYMPLKGVNMKALYPKPELRVMGDADILIRKEQYDRIRSIVSGLGFEEKLESDHEYVWQSDALFLELHKRVIPSYNRDYYAYFGDGWRLAKEQSGTRYAMSREDELVYQFTHFAKHYRDGGIGCRHMLDLWIYLRAYPAMDMEKVRNELKKLQLEEFFENILRLMNGWFENGPMDEKTEFMTEFIFGSGSWGQAESHLLSAEAKNMKAAGSARGGKLRSLRQAAFPPARDLWNRYPVLKKAPILLPVIWPVRWVEAVLFRREHIVQKQNALRSATAEKVAGYQQALNYVGLDFRFGE